MTTRSRINLPGDWITVTEFAELAGVTDSTVYRWLSKSMLYSIDMGKWQGVRVFGRRAALEWIKLNIKEKK